VRYDRGSSPRDTLEELTREVNTLAETLQVQRLRAVEATALLQKVMEEIGVAVFAFDSERRVKLVNRAAEALLNLLAGRIEPQFSARRLAVGSQFRRTVTGDAGSTTMFVRKLLPSRLGT
jgi:nitrogen fixation/metabolism regulation signal transduction histidine kinase